MTKQELWALIEHHANAILGDGPKVCIERGTRRALNVDHHAARIAELSREVYKLEVRDEDGGTVEPPGGVPIREGQMLEIGTYTR